MLFLVKRAILKPNSKLKTYVAGVKRELWSMDKPLDAEIERWAALLHRYGLAEFAVFWFDVLQLWGFLGAQMLWMFSYFSSSSTLTTLATALEAPEVWQALQQRLIKGGAPG